MRRPRIVFGFPKKKKTRRFSLPEVLPGLERLKAGLLRSSRPSARAHDHFNHGQMDCSNNLLISEAERSRLRSWCKQEYLDNPQARSLARNFALGIYGNGPTLQFQTGEEHLNEVLEAVFARWRQRVNLDWLFHLALNQLFYDGESFFYFYDQPTMPGGIGVELLEARRIQDPLGTDWRPDRLEGITYNDWGEPVYYHVLIENSNPMFGMTNEYGIVPAERMSHFFLEDVVNQKRGLPMLQSALEMLASMQRITNASLGAWELAAKMNLVIQTGMDAYNFVQCVPKGLGDDEVTCVDAFSTKQIPEDGGMTFLANGMTMNQVKNEHPNSQFGDHTQTFQKIAGLSAGLPENMATGSSANYNFSSAQMDFQLFSRFGGVCQKKILGIMRKCVAESLRGAARRERIPEVVEFLQAYPEPDLWPIEWYFPTVLSSIDRINNAAADVQLLQAGLTTIKEYCKRYGLNYATINNESGVEC